MACPRSQGAASSAILAVVPTSSILSDAVIAARAGDSRRTLELLLEAWRARRQPEFAERIGRVSPLAAASAPKDVPPHDPVSIERIVSMPELRSPKNVLDVVTRFARVPPDPRIGEYALRQLRAGHAWMLDRYFQQMLERHAHAGMLPELAKARAQVKPACMQHLDEIRLGLALHQPIALTADEQASLEALDAALDSLGQKDPRQLLLQAYDNPDDPTLLQVLADHLCEKGDPRGEFLQLQFLHERGGGTDATRKTEASLWRKHWKAWYPELKAALAPTTTRCRRGLLWRVGIRADPGAPLREIVRQPSFKPVREIVIHGPDTKSVLSVLPPAIEAVWDLDPFAAQRHEHTLPFARIGLSWLDHPLRWTPELNKLQDQAPNLLVLGIDAVEFPESALASLKRPLDVLCLRTKGLPPQLERVPVREARLGATALKAWDAPDQIWRRDADGTLKRVVPSAG